MTTIAQIKSAWSAAIWTNATITAMTDKIYAYDITTDSTKEFAKLRYQQQINAFTYEVFLAEQMRIMGQIKQQFDVKVTYYLQADVAGANHALVLSRFETLNGLVRSSLGSSWTSTVDYHQFQEAPVELSQTVLEGFPVWKGIYIYTGFKNL